MEATELEADGAKFYAALKELAESPNLPNLQENMLVDGSEYSPPSEAAPPSAAGRLPVLFSPFFLSSVRTS